MFRAVDRLLDKITMYRLLLYYLIALLLIAIGLSATHELHYNPVYIASSAVILVAVCWSINKVLAYIFKAPTNSESSLITALILALIISPTPYGLGLAFLIAASVIAMSSKYVLAIGRKHIFNPAAVAIALTALGPRQTADWWVGTASMLPFVLAGGVLVIRKINKGEMVISFLISTFLATVVYSLIGKTSIMTNFHDLIFSSALFFLAFVMLTEPQTSPSTKTKQNWYAALVGILVPPQAHLLNFYSSPELALVIGNAFSYLVSPKIKLFPVLKQKYEIAANTMDFVFNPGGKIKYRPGQYMEWTLPHKTPDSRGNRRYFTLASSPTESEIIVGVKFYENGSSFKRSLLNLNQDTSIVASQLAGDFVLPKNKDQKITFIAGGIGITPFRSMVKYLVDKNQSRDIVLLYSSATDSDIAYKVIFLEARDKIGLKPVFILTKEKPKTGVPNTVAGPITKRLIKETMPDYLDRLFYISGTHAMVVDMQNILRDLGVHHAQIKVDFFPGYV